MARTKKISNGKNCPAANYEIPHNFQRHVVEDQIRETLTDKFAPCEMRCTYCGKIDSIYIGRWNYSLTEVLSEMVLDGKIALDGLEFREMEG